MAADNTKKRVPVSVVIPCYKCSGTIDFAFRSVINQSVLPEEICLIDDASRDDGKTVTVLYSLRERFRRIVKTTIISLEENMGPGFARNAGWEAATQPYVAFLDADDAWHPQKLELVHDVLEKNPQIDLIGHDFYLKNDAAKIQTYLPEEEGRIVRKHFPSILLMNPFVTPSFVLRRRISQRFNPRLRYCEDHEFLLRVSITGNVFHLRRKLVQLGREPFAEGGLTAERRRMRAGEIAMYLAVLKYRKGVVPLLPALILFSVLKHIILFGLSFLRGKLLNHDQ